MQKKLLLMMMFMLSFMGYARADEQDDWCSEEDKCYISYVLNDGFGDGWNGAAIEVVDAETGTVIETLTLSTGSSDSGLIAVCPGRELSFVWVAGNYDEECSFAIYDSEGDEIVSGSGDEMVDGEFETYLVDCTYHLIPFVQAAHTSAKISWKSVGDSYKVRYRTMEKLLGYSTDFEDGLPEGWTTRDADGDGFCWLESTKASTSLFNCHSGSNCMTSASWDSNTGNALTPDNWLISPEIELDGTLRVWLCGQDADYAKEHFAIYVSLNGDDFIEVLPETVATGEYVEYTADLSEYAGQTGYIAIRHYNVTDMFFLNVDDFTIDIPGSIPAGEWVEVETTDLSVFIEGLTANTDYEYEIIAYLDGEEVETATGTFTTASNGTAVFVNDGDWADADNWDEGILPDVDGKVSVQAAAVINAGEVAEAKAITIEGGSITLKDGAQLISGNDVKVTVEKNVTGGVPCLLTMPFDINPTSVKNAVSENSSLYYFAKNYTYEWIDYNELPFSFSTYYGYMYGNADDVVLSGTGTAMASKETYKGGFSLSYSDNGYDYDGWMLLGNPFTCNGYIYLTDTQSSFVGYKIYKLNEAGDGFDVYEDAAPVSPLEAFFIEITDDAYLYFYSYDIFEGQYDYPIADTYTLPVLPVIGQSGDQDASRNIDLADAEENTTFLEANDALHANVTLNGRTLYKDGTWNTLCLPFDVPVSGSVIDGAEAKVLSGASVADGELTLTFSEALETITAGEPCLVRWPDGGDNLVSPTFRRVLINAAEPVVGTNSIVNMVGFYDPYTLTAQDQTVLYLGSNNTLHYPTSNLSMGAFRAYFQLGKGYTVGDPSGIRSFVLDFNEGNTATGIIDINAASRDMQTVYDLQGRKVATDAARRGVYVVNGQKKVVK